VLRIQLQPVIRHVELTISPDLPAIEVAQFRNLAMQPGLMEGQPFHDEALDDFIRQVAFGETLTSFRGTAFDPATGVLHLMAEPIRLKAVTVPPGGFRDAVAELFAPMVGVPIRPMDMIQRMNEVRERFNCTQLEDRVEPTPEGVILHLKPERERIFTLGVQLAYESTWGGHIGLDARLRNPTGYGSTARFLAAYNDLQKQSMFSLRKEVSGLTGVGGDIYAYSFTENFRPNLTLPFLPAHLSGDSRLHYGGGGLGGWVRFGEGKKALLKVDFDQRTSSQTFFGTLQPDFKSQVIEASVEWDSLNYHLLPTSGAVFRLRGGDSMHAESAQVIQEPFRFAYGQYRLLQAVSNVGVSLDMGAEIGMGWHTPADRWYILGGSSSIIGSASASYLSPNFGTLRLGLPLTSVGVLGLGIQVVPRVDWTRISSTPESLSNGTRILGSGLIFRSIVRNFYVEFAAGQTQARGEFTHGTQKNNQLSFLIGARPFDLWKHR
jgi:hypothetical protein